MPELSKLPNIGKTLEKRLAAAGIEDSETLLREGSREAFFKLHIIEGDTCFSTLCALEGAVKGIRWHKLSDDERAELKKYYDTI